MTDPAGARIVLTRWNAATAAVALLLTAVLAAGPLLALLTAHSTGDRILLGIVTAVFGAPFLWTLWRIPKAMRGMGIAIDDVGISEFDGGNVATVPWSEVERVGFGSRSRRYRGLKTTSPAAFEVYRQGESEAAIRCSVSPFGDHAERLEEGVRRFRPDVWAGPFIHER